MSERTATWVLWLILSALLITAWWVLLWPFNPGSGTFEGMVSLFFALLGTVHIPIGVLWVENYVQEGRIL